MDHQQSRPHNGEAWRVVIADDHEVTRSGIKLMLDILDGVEVVGEASNGSELLEECRRTTPDAVLTDLDMPELDGVQATERLTQDFPGLPVLVLTVHEDGESVSDALRAGATGYVSKSASADEVRRALEALRTGQGYLSSGVTAAAIRSMSRTLAERSRVGHAEGAMTPREREVLQEVARGLSARKIARRLGISERTVSTHIGNVYRKLGVNNRVDAVLAGMRAGLVRAPQETTPR